MITQYTFLSTSFSPTPSELNEEDEDYINPGLFARELAEFLIAGLRREGYDVADRIVEDWGNRIVIAHEGEFALAVCCSNLDDFGTGPIMHRVATDPFKPYVRRFLRKIHVQPAVERLSDALSRILHANPAITDIEAG